MNYEQAIAFLEKLPQKKRWSLEPTKELAKAARVRVSELKTIHVAGTNGKASVVAFIASILRRAGFKVGEYYSPHLVKINERICVNGKQIADEELAKQATELAPFIRAFNKRSKEKISFFEALTIIAFKHFAEKKTDYAVVETGLGGRLDATNVIKPLVSVITSVSLDHARQLGATTKKIAREKAGIIKSRGLCVTSCSDAGALTEIKRVCRKKRARFFTVGESGDVCFKTVSATQEKTVFDVSGVFGSARLETRLLGAHQAENAAAAFAAVKALRAKGIRVSNAAVRAGLKKAFVPGRLEVVSRAPLVVLDGAHNPGGARALARSLAEIWGGRKIVLLFAAMRDKDSRAVLGELAPLAEKIVVARVPIPRSASLKRLAREARGFNARVEAVVGVRKAFERAKKIARESGARGMVCACGSLYLVGEVKKLGLLA